MQKSYGFTLAEMVVVVALIVILSTTILFTTLYFVNRSKNSNIHGNLSILIPAGEVYYDGPGEKSYYGFCGSSVVLNSFEQMPLPSSYTPYCKVSDSYDKWVACVKLFTPKNPEKAFCVDSRGVKEEIDIADCPEDSETDMPNFECPPID